MIWLLALLALILTVENVFDVFSTTQALKRGNVHEANGWVAWCMRDLGHWWWIVKLPSVVLIWYDVIFRDITIWHIASPFSAAVWNVPATIISFSIAIAFYAYVLWNNYKIAWRH